MLQWAAGNLSDVNAYKQKAAVDSALAQYRCIEELRDLNYEQYSEVMHDDDYNRRIRTGSSWPGSTLPAIYARNNRVGDQPAGTRDGTGTDAGDEGNGDVAG